MFNYARSDTHFLLYVYDNLRNELIEKSDTSVPDGDLISIVLQKSKEVALQRFERPLYDAQRGMGSGGWFNLLSNTPALFSREQFSVFRAVHQWRDSIARKEDESVNMIMPKHVIFNIAREMPVEIPALLGCSHPISAPVRARTGELLGIIRDAKMNGASGPDLNETMQSANPAHNENEGFGDSRAPTAVVVAERPLPPALIADENLRSRLINSLFWGSTVGTRPASNKNCPPMDSVRLVLPLPQLTAEIYGDSEFGLKPVADRDPGSRAEHAYVKDRKPKEQDVFVLKDVGGPRKRKAASLDEQPERVLSNGPEIDLTNGNQGAADEMEDSLRADEEEQAAQGKAESKAERKAQRKLEKQRRKLKEQQREMADVNGNTAEENAPFDYENAPSVLHARKDRNEMAGPEKGFNPYSKSLDAPKGMRRARKETTGKSFTFKS